MADRPNTIQLEIFGQVYSVKAGKEPGYIEHIAAYVDAQMREVSRAAGAVDSMKIAVLAGLNIADELFRAKLAAHQAEEKLQAAEQKLQEAGEQNTTQSAEAQALAVERLQAAHAAADERVRAAEAAAAQQLKQIKATAASQVKEAEATAQELVRDAEERIRAAEEKLAQQVKAAEAQAAERIRAVETMAAQRIKEAEGKAAERAGELARSLALALDGA